MNISTVEMHTGGEPVRIVVDGYPPIEGATILEKRRYVTRELDHLRRLLMFEPRGHFDMYGVIPVEPDDPEADLAVLFMHNEGYSTMCGHATIALGRFAVDRGIVEASEPETTVRLQVPSGLVTITVEVIDGVAGAARYASVPSFLSIGDLEIEPTGLGRIKVDVAYGGAFYALASASDLGWQLDRQPVATIAASGTAITAA
ncbi:MAG: proline racemase family protein, partial [Acidimicrobiia bacterium]|nr:proline racemase family protein [Acidimicrobiia bacterium]